MPDRVSRRIDLEYTLFMPHGRAPTTQSRAWFFDVPRARDTDASWTELLHRVFYDANVKLRRREPGDENWLGLVSFKAAPVDAAAMLAWDGVATLEAAARHLPWIVAEGAVVWESSACLYVTEAGRYVGLTSMDFSELVLWHALDAEQVSTDSALAFLRKLYARDEGGMAERVLAERLKRTASFETASPTVAFRRAPGDGRFGSGPVRPEHL